MAKKPASGGASNMNSALSNKTSISDLNDDQLAHLGGSRDPIDAEDFSDADFGNDITKSPDDEEPSDEVDTDGKDEPEDDKAEEEPAAEKDEPADDDEEEPAAEKDEPAEDDEEEPAAEKGEPAEDDEEEPAAEKDEPAAEEEPEEDAEEETEQRVPLKRFRDVNKRMREAEKRAEELERRMAALEGNEPGEEETPYDFDAAEERYQDLLLDGQKKDATALRKEIRAAEQATYIKAADAIGGRNAEASHAKRGLDTLAAKYEAEYPQMDLTHEDFDPEVNLEVQASMIGYIDQGMDSVKAFEKALNKTVKLFDLKPVSAAPAGGKGKGKAKADKKEAPAPTKEQLAKQKKAGKEKVAKSKKAPPDTTKVGDPGDGGKNRNEKEHDVEAMSEEEFNALPKSTLARLRGDIL